MTPTYEQLREWFTPARAARFWRKVEKNATPEGCWLWRGSLTETGHGQYRMLDGVVRIHRLTWILARQRDIPDWMVIRHLMCSNRACCNPSHIVGGTQGENVEDQFLHASYDYAAEELARIEYTANPYLGFFSEKGICNPTPVDRQQSNRLHLSVPTVSKGMYPFPAIA